MKRNVLGVTGLIVSLCLTLSASCVFAQQIACPYNIDWETGDTTGWTAQLGGPLGSFPGGVNGGTTTPVPMTLITTPVNGFLPGRHDIMNSSMPPDPFGGFPVVAPSGGGYAIRIGDSNISWSAERIQFMFTVPAGINNYSVNFLYAVVLQNPNHDPDQQPRFTVSLKDAATGLPIKDGCYDLNFVADASLPGFQSTRKQVQYKPWTKHTLNLSGTAGKTVIVDVVVGDCDQGGHFGYGYFDVENCGIFEAKLDSCNLDRGGAYLRGPEGYMTYEWYNNDYSKLMDTGQFVAFQPNSMTPEKYHLILTPFPSVSLCKDTIHTIPIANININRIDSTCLVPETPVVLNAGVYGGAGPLTYQWSEMKPLGTLSCTTCEIATATTPETNWYTIRVEDTNHCHKSDIMTVGINEDTVKAMDDFVLCRPGYTQLDVKSMGLPPRSPLTCGISAQPPCTSPENLNMLTLFRDPLGAKEDTTTVNNPFTAQYTSAHMQFILKKEDLYASGLRYGTLSSLGFEVAKVGSATFSNVTISLACTDQNILGGTFIPNPTLVFTASSPVTLVDGWNDFVLDNAYDWDKEKNLVVDICVSGASSKNPPTLFYTNTGEPDAVVAYTTGVNGNVCADGKSNNLEIYTGRPTVRGGFCKSPDALYQYTWSPGDFLQDSTIQKPYAYVNKTIDYFVETMGGSECKLKDTLHITVPTHDYDIYPRDTSVCFGQKYKMNAFGGAISSVQWYEINDNDGSFMSPANITCESCSDPAQSLEPIVQPRKTTTYAAVYKDKYGCLDTFFSHGVIRPLPVVHILNNDTTIKYGQSVQLLASGAYLYSWNPLGSITNPNLSNPHVAPTEPTTFYVWGLAEDGCRNIDSVKINIDYRDNLFVPSAFTPNGDGKNDVFRISNITFQKLEEFRVFNRWGQEIFSTTDPASGWNGSWKGVPQDMGVYEYLIRVAYPDGYVETYKGNVTLVR